MLHIFDIFQSEMNCFQVEFRMFLLKNDLFLLKNYSVLRQNYPWQQQKRPIVNSILYVCCQLVARLSRAVTGIYTIVNAGNNF